MPGKQNVRKMRFTSFGESHFYNSGTLTDDVPPPSRIDIQITKNESVKRIFGRI